MNVWANSHKGLVRATNQDTFLIDTDFETETAVMAVCDGMGGANAGNVASKFAADAFLEAVRRSLKPEMGQQELRETLTYAVTEANAQVFELSKKQEEFKGMGTTIVGALYNKGNIALINVGDSRGYLLHGGAMQQITLDHSFVEEMVRKGKLTREEAKTHPVKNLITRAVGIERVVDSDVFDVPMEEGDTLLLCSDGLTGMVPDDEILEIILQADNLEEACRTLIDRACDSGGRDNITVLLFSK